jgi:hypothetical protein
MEEAGPMGPVAPLTALCLDLGLPQKKQGSFNYDQKNSGFNHEWTSLAKFDTWRWQEEITYVIEFILSKMTKGKEFKQKRVY